MRRTRRNGTLLRGRRAARALELEVWECVRAHATAERPHVLCAFSGGSDSLALLLTLVALSGQRRLRVTAAHLDHGLDDGSSDRARRAQELAAELDVPCSVGTAPPQTLGAPKRGVEDRARTLRYAFLETTRRSTGADCIVTAHHLDDQVETVLLRLMCGSGPLGLGSIQERNGRVLRPLLKRRRCELDDLVEASELTPVVDPSNRDERILRNRIRHRLLPHLHRDIEGLRSLAARVAAAASGAHTSVRRRLESELDVAAESPGASLSYTSFLRLPSALRLPALATLQRKAGATYPPPRATAAELERQIERRADPKGVGRRIAVDCGARWRWEVRSRRLVAQRREAPIACRGSTA